MNRSPSRRPVAAAPSAAASRAARTPAPAAPARSRPPATGRRRTPGSPLSTAGGAPAPVRRPLAHA
ncbi:hypothetical protein [Kitasatospora albolonga]|uniref:hypothetical protein n=1 Tax=Kitasatospora albolonga TaxID=68173 RepID=UPI00131D1F96